ncbi:glycoside hydrolase family 13 protein [Pontibacillus salicampi]|uniref:Glycoside hydrolase family 13 protein n=1 Tax=Pontibacillus salicampi TaxID=1449801 RepID=A0ABV6LUD1_9BACI
MKQQDMYHNSFEKKYRNPFGAAPKGSHVALLLDIHQRHQIHQVLLHYIYDRTNEEVKAEMTFSQEVNQYNSYVVELEMPEEPQLIWYYFEIQTEEGSLFYGRIGVEESGEGRLYDHVPPSWQITVYDAEYDTPSWWKNAIMYQIFPDRFHVGGTVEPKLAPPTSLMHSHWENDPIYIRNESGDVVRWDFFGGNLQGITEKLDYIQSLGVTVLYVNPIFEAESNHRYDTGDYHKIDRLLGSKEDFEKLVSEAKKRNMEVMLDGVFSHTGSNSIYFNRKGQYDSLGAYQSKQSPYYDWYTFYDFPNEYEAWWGIGTLPTLNKENESYQRFLVHDEDSVIQHWQRRGINHWRLDVADELTDDLIRQIYTQLKQHNKDSVLLGEVWEDASNKTAYGMRRDYFLGGVLDSVMNYPLRRLMLDFVKGDIDSLFLQRRVLTLAEHYPKPYFYGLMNLLSSHDVARAWTMVQSFLPQDIGGPNVDRIIRKQIKGLSLWLYTFPGVPSLYYGDEAGVTGEDDPDNRKPYPWGREDEDLLEWYRRIGEWRTAHPVLRTGSLITHAPDKEVFGFERFIHNGTDEFGNKAENEHMLFLFNRHLKEERVVALPIRKGEWEHMTNGEIIRTRKGKLTLTLEPGESILLKHNSS